MFRSRVRHAIDLHFPLSMSSINVANQRLAQSQNCFLRAVVCCVLTLSLGCRSQKHILYLSYRQRRRHLPLESVACHLQWGEKRKQFIFRLGQNSVEHVDAAHTLRQIGGRLMNVLLDFEQLFMWN